MSVEFRIDEPHDLRPLEVAIYRDGTLERIVEMHDPRARFCETYNGLADGTTAYPVSRATNLASSSRRPE